jgi:putative two-component system response regulator
MTDHPSFSVLIIDDTEMNIDILVAALAQDYEVSVAMDGESALQIIAENPPDLILLDIMMPRMDGYQVCERLKSGEKTRKIPIIFLTALAEEQDEARGLQLGAVDYIIKPFSPELIRARVRNQIELKRHKDHLEELVQERTMEVTLTQDATIFALATLAEYRDPETGGHIKRTQKYIQVLAEHLKSHHKFGKFLDERTVALLSKSAPLHDIGKVGVADSILLKPGKLTAGEFEEVKKHTVFGRNTLARSESELGNVTSSFLRHGREIAYTHHEKWDGSGYPQGLSGDSIPISGRLMAVVDVYDALISKRIYKPPFTHEKAIDTMREGKGRHFDPDILEAFLDVEGEFRHIAHEFSNSDEERRSLSCNS